MKKTCDNCNDLRYVQATIYDDFTGELIESQVQACHFCQWNGVKVQDFDELSEKQQEKIIEKIEAREIVA